MPFCAVSAVVLFFISFLFVLGQISVVRSGREKMEEDVVVRAGASLFLLFRSTKEEEEEKKNSRRLAAAAAATAEFADAFVR